MFHIDAHLNYSNVNYKGSGMANNIHDFMAEPRFWVGKDFRFSQSRITPYLGFGYRHLYDNFGRIEGGYDRTSHYLYVPVGFELAFPALNQWHALFNPEFDIFIHGWQDSKLAQADIRLPNFTNHQNSGYGARGSIKLWKQFNNFTFSITPYVRYWNIRQSETVTKQKDLIIVTAEEPANNSLEIGSKFGVIF